jgi:hypothetical protein
VASLQPVAASTKFDDSALSKKQLNDRIPWSRRRLLILK